GSDEVSATALEARAPADLDLLVEGRELGGFEAAVADEELSQENAAPAAREVLAFAGVAPQVVVGDDASLEEHSPEKAVPRSVQPAPDPQPSVWRGDRDGTTRLQRRACSRARATAARNSSLRKGFMTNVARKLASVSRVAVADQPLTRMIPTRGCALRTS